MTLLSDAIAAHGLEPSTADAIDRFVTLFETWNRSINLSAARTREAIEEHVVDSLAIVPYLRDAQRVLDVGSGGGFPVVVATIVLPNVEFVALEPVHKKHAFLRTAARELALPNLDARAERLEDHASNDYDVAMSRATFDLNEWLERGRSRVRAGGVILGFEGIPVELLASTERLPYELRGKTRAIVRLRT